MRKLTWLFLLIFFLPIVHGEATSESDRTAIYQLLESARLWEAKKRDDLAIAALIKASNLAPHDPLITTRLGEIYLRTNQVERAKKVLDQLEQDHPSDAATIELKNAYRLATQDRRTLATIEFLSKRSPKDREALVPELKALFPDGPPSGEVGLRYYHLLARVPSQQTEARKGFLKLEQSMPGDSRPELELIEMDLNDEKLRLSALKRLKSLADHGDIKRDDLIKIWGDGLSEVERTPQTESYFLAFSQYFPDAPVPELVLTPEDRKKKELDERTRQATEKVRAADSFVKQGDINRAEALYAEALKLDPTDNEVRLSLAKLYWRNNRLKESEQLYRETLSKDAQNTRALSGLMAVLDKEGRSEEALSIGQKALSKKVNQSSGIADEFTTLVRTRADEQLSQGHRDDAIKTLQSGLDLTPDSAWIRYDLANIYSRYTEISKAKMLFTVGPKGEKYLYAKALFLSGLGEYSEAHDVLDSIPLKERTPSILELQHKTEIRLGFQTALNEDHLGHHLKAVHEMEVAVEKARGSRDLLWESTDVWMDMDEQQRALALARDLMGPKALQANNDDLLQYSSILLSANDALTLPLYLKTLSTRTDLTPSQTDELASLGRRFAVREAWAARRAGHPEESVSILKDALQRQPNDKDLWSTLANINYLADQPDEAIDIYQNMIVNDPKDYDLKLSLAKALKARGDEDEALNQIDAIDRELPITDRNTRLGLAEQYADHGDFTKARAMINDVMAKPPLERKTLLYAGLIEKKDRNYDQALMYFNQVPNLPVKANPVGTNDKDLIEDALKEKTQIEQRPYGYITSGVDVRQLSGSSGTSDIINVDIPTLIRIPNGYNGHVWVQTDAAAVFAGQLDLSTFSNANQFGKINALCPSTASGPIKCGATTLPSSSNQYAYGAPLAVGYQMDNWQFDLGSTPIGFPVSTFVGGIHHSGSLGIGYYSWDISRRPAANSLLSYAGVHDPVTGQVWGGVTTNGAEFYTAADVWTTRFGILNTFFQGSAHYLEGQNVQSNEDLMIRTGGDWTVLNGEDSRVSIGLAAMFLKFANNQRHYTFGYGGYWSPQTYLSIGPPIQWTGRYGDLSYLVRGYTTYSYSQENSGAYYPTDSALQNSSLNGNAMYSGTSGPAISYGIRAKVEYQMTPQWFLGAHFEKAQSPFYTPNYGGLYFRFALEPRTEKIPFPPENPLPYYRY